MIDTGVYYAFFDTRDEYYLDSLAMLTHCIEGRFGQPFTTDYVILEATTLMQKRLGSDVSLAFLDFIRDNKIKTFVVDEECYESALKLFRKEFKRLSFCDSGTIVAMNELSISSLASYDTRSFAGLVAADIYGKKYFVSLNEKDAADVRKKIAANFRKSTL